MIKSSTFKPAWWLANPHVQTIYSSFQSHIPLTIDKTEQLELLDGDFIELAWHSAGLPEDSPLIIILHARFFALPPQFARSMI